MTDTSSFRFTPDALRRIRRLAGRGKSFETIAKDIACDVASLDRICRQHGIVSLTASAAPSIAPYERPRTTDHRLDPERRRDRGGIQPVIIEISRGANNALMREAAKRGTTPAVLTARLIEIVAADDLFGAVLNS